MKKITAFLLFGGLAFLTACETEDPVIPNEEELITTVVYTLSPDNGSGNVILKFTDLDGDGGNAPVIETAALQANTTYTGKLEFLNELESPAEDITEEVEEEAAEHQVFFESTGGISISYNDTDGDGFPLGLSTKVSTSSTGSGSITITLRHEPNKGAMGVSEGNIANAGGETDIAVSFAVNVQ